MIELYKKIIGSHGDIFEFGTRWGRNISLFITLRGIFEPYNHTRKVVAFDTFSGFNKIENEDGDHESLKIGAFSVSDNYFNYFSQLLEIKEKELPINHIKKFHIIKGDVSKTTSSYINEHPQTIIALACFDLDLYKPTKDALREILPRMNKGGIIMFDELNHSAYQVKLRHF